MENNNQQIVKRLFETAHCCECTNKFGDRLTILHCDRIHRDGNGANAVAAVCDICLEKFIVAMAPGRDGVAIRRDNLAEPKFVIVVEAGPQFLYVDVNSLPSIPSTGFAKVRSYPRPEVSADAA